MQPAVLGLPPTPALVPPALASPAPAPTSPTLSRSPRRKIFTEADLVPWFRSEAYAFLQATIIRLTAAVVGRRNDDACSESPAVTTLVRFLRDARERIAQVPLQTGPQRFGNPAFRDWLAHIELAEPALQQTLLALAPDLTESIRAALLPEATFHLLASFGSPQRLDYGTGHELSFVAYLVCLLRARVLTSEDERALVLRVFAEYLETVRELQRVFRLEPAGSKGVWGLDDHQHLAYLFGAAQLVDHPTLRPSSILTASTVQAHAQSYLFLSSVAHIHTLKRGPFHEHSPLLHQIATTVPTFAKVVKGLWEMYRAEVLAKLPVVQHERFGEVALRWVDKESGEELPSSGDGREPFGEDDGERVAGRTGSESGAVTPAPWAAAATPGSSGGTHLNNPTTSSYTSSSSAAVSRLGPSTRVSTSFSRRQHPVTFPLAPTPPSTRTMTSPTAAAPPYAYAGQQQRTSFQPPPLFPSRNRATEVPAPASQPSSSSSSGGGTANVAVDSGVAATSSPLGELPPPVGLGPHTPSQ